MPDIVKSQNCAVGLDAFTNLDLYAALLAQNIASVFMLRPRAKVVIDHAYRGPQIYITILGVDADQVLRILDIGGEIHEGSAQWTFTDVAPIAEAINALEEARYEAFAHGFNLGDQA